MSTMATSVRMNELSSIVGEQYVVEAPQKLKDLTIDGVTPAIAVTPGSVEEVAAVLRYAYEHDLNVVPAGGFVHQEIGNIPTAVDLLLRTERLTGIEHYDPGDLTIGVGAGVTISELQSLVRDQGQVFPIDIANADRVTIGGAMAVAASGPHRHFFGGLRDFCLGVRFVTAEGKAAKGGGRVVKNVAGFDLMKLMIGSYGTLAVITSASFKLFPHPVATRTFVCEFASLNEAIEFRDFVMASPLSPICLELLSPKASVGGTWTIAVRAGGSDRVLARYGSELGSAVTAAFDGSPEHTFWDRVEKLGNESPVKVAVSVPPNSGGEVIGTMERLAGENHLELQAWGRIGVGFLLMALNGGMAENYVGCIRELRKSLPRDASTVVMRCPVSLKPEISVWGTSPNNMDAMMAAKRALSPKDNLNRGRFLL
ncbi:MAG TPA: FAD-binding oxidoreductase [Terriglobales bacterium]|nr:FAD-binding oxidoreductase [Terriglobales bacterium]